jgi:hypothetical protein
VPQDHPIPWDLPVEQEDAALAALEPRMRELWSNVFPRDDEPYTSVVVPSVTASDEDHARHPDANAFEEVLLFLLIRLRNPRARVVFVTSRPIPPSIVDYHLHFLAGIPASHAAARLTMLSAHDASPRPLIRKILDRPRLVARLREAIPDRSRAYLTVLRAGPMERRLAVLLGIPLNAAGEGAEALCTKSNGRRILREAGVDVPRGAEDLRDADDIAEALLALRQQVPGLRRAILKRDSSLWEEGHAVVTLPPSATRETMRGALDDLALAGRMDSAEYVDRFARVGGVVEELVEDVTGTASGQVRVNPLGEVTLTATHDELRGGPVGLESSGCLFPAAEAYRGALAEASLRVGRVLADRGIVSRLSVEYLVRRPAEGAVQLLGTEINLGFGGATHPLLAVRFLTDGRFDPTTGLFLSTSGQPKHYRATDDLQAPEFHRLIPEDLIEILTMGRLNYTPHGEAGALFYMIGGIAERGRVGMVAIGNSRDQADQIFRQTASTLERESRRRPER